MRLRLAKGFFQPKALSGCVPVSFPYKPPLWWSIELIYIVGAYALASRMLANYSTARYIDPLCATTCLEVRKSGGAFRLNPRGLNL